MQLGIFSPVAVLFLALPLAGAEFNFEIRLDSGTVTATSQITTTNAVLSRIDAWRQEQLIPDLANPGQFILKYPTSDALFKFVLIEFFKTMLDKKPTTAIQAELDKITASQQEIKDLKEQAAQ